MAGKKRTIPNHVKQKEFIHPQESHSVISIFRRIEDPRKPSLSFCHSLTSGGSCKNKSKELFKTFALCCREQLAP